MGKECGEHTYIHTRSVYICIYFPFGKDPLVILCASLVKLSTTDLITYGPNLEFSSQTVTLNKLPNIFTISFPYLIQFPQSFCN